MRQHSILSAAAGLACLGLSSCGHMDVKTVPLDAEGEGLRVQMATPHHVEAFFKSPDGKLIQKTGRFPLPSAKTVHLMNFKGALFAKRDLLVKLHANGALEQYKFTSTSEADTAVKNLGDFGKDFATARNQINPPAEEVDPNQELIDELRADMLRANAAAAAKGVALPYPEVLQ